MLDAFNFCKDGFQILPKNILECTFSCKKAKSIHSCIIRHSTGPYLLVCLYSNTEEIKYMLK